MRFRSALFLASFALSQLGYDCEGGRASSRDTTPGTTPVLGDSNNATGGVAYGPSDGGNEYKTAHGSPLCGIVAVADATGNDATCTPDESDAARLVAQCTDEPLNDAGPRVTACRIDVSSGSPHPACVRSGAADEGARCSISSDCGAGLECVGRAGSGGTEGVCRKYCCLNECDDPQRFCDFGRTHENANVVPVCAPVKTCTLLSTGTCASTETCSVVRDDGVASCVLLGRASTGTSCELERCGANQACVGSKGMRKCVSLCRVGGNDCAGTTTCRSTSLITDPHIGICQ